MRSLKIYVQEGIYNLQQCFQTQYLPKLFFYFMFRKKITLLALVSLITYAFLQLLKRLFHGGHFVERSKLGSLVLLFHSESACFLKGRRVFVSQLQLYHFWSRCLGQRKKGNKETYHTKFLFPKQEKLPRDLLSTYFYLSPEAPAYHQYRNKFLLKEILNYYALNTYLLFTSVSF